MPPTFEKLGSSSLRGRIAERVRAAILDGSLMEGERLVERRLSDAFGASLTAVREALVELEVEGFLMKLPNSATYVIRLTHEDVQKIMSVRRALEGLAISEAARLATPEDARRLSELYEAGLAAARLGDVRGYLAKEMALHEGIWNVTGNHYLYSSLRRLLAPYQAFSTLRMTQWSAEDLERRVVSHKSILDAIAANDVQGAQNAFHEAFDLWNPNGWPTEPQRP
jgi:DNA-binding GntR family transcriptional regulator